MRIRGNEGEILTEQESNDSQQNYANSFSQDPSFLNFQIFGKKFIKGLLAVEGAKGLKLTLGLRYNPDTDMEQLYLIPTAVDKHGNAIPGSEELEVDEEQDDEAERMQIMGDSNPPPIRCPNSCN